MSTTADHADLITDVMLGIFEGMTPDQQAEHFATLAADEKQALANVNEQASDLLFAETIAAEEADEFDWFEQITEADREYMQRRLPQACGFCGGRHRHNPDCVALTEGFVIVMPWGKHKGHRVADVPADYLRWLWKRGAADMPGELRQEIARVLKVPLFEEVTA
jgi:uncharacterized protein (DUF3820 family)